MKKHKYFISRGYYACHTTTVEATSEEEAIALAKENPDQYWKDTGGDTDILYQVEDIQ